MNSRGFLLGLVWSALGERIIPAPGVDITLEIMVARRQVLTAPLRTQAMLYATNQHNPGSRMDANEYSDTGVKAVGLSFDMFADEDPNEEELRTFLTSVDDKLKSLGLTYFAVPGIRPPSGAYAPDVLAPTPPVGTNFALGQLPEDHVQRFTIAQQNAATTRNNDKKQALWEELVRERRDRIAGALQVSLRPHAPLLLQKLEKECAYASPYEPQINGAAMLQSIRDMKGKSMESNREHAKGVQRQADYIRDNPLPDNCTARQFNTRVNFFLREARARARALLPDLSCTGLVAEVVRSFQGCS